MSLTKTQLEKYAQVLIWGLQTARTEKYKPYDIIWVRYELGALPLAEVLMRELTKKKYNVYLKCLGTPTIEKDFFTYSDKNQRTFIQWKHILISTGVINSFERCGSQKNE
jgi:aminopeptidase